MPPRAPTQGVFRFRMLEAKLFSLKGCDAALTATKQAAEKVVTG